MYYSLRKDDICVCVHVDPLIQVEGNFACIRKTIDDCLVILARVRKPLLNVEYRPTN
jgi:hypothetical protein